MYALNIDYFLPPIEDIEYNQYKILAILKEYRKHFRQNKLYPAFTELNQINRFLSTFLSKSSVSKSTDSKKIKTLFPDEIENNSENEKSETQYDPEAIEITEWAKPQVESALRDGYAIYEFVLSNLFIKTLEPIPSYREQGYFVVHDRSDAQLLFIEYTRYSSKSTKAPVRSLKTRLLRQVPFNENYSTITELSIKLIEKYGNLINPAIYICDSNIEFPFSETIFPIAKSKLLYLLTKHQVKDY